MRLGRCCRILNAVGRLRLVDFGGNLIEHARLAIAEDCTTCLEAYEEALPSTPFVNARVKALGLIGRALQSIVHSRGSAAVHERLTAAVRHWPGPSHPDHADRQWLPAHQELPVAPERRAGLDAWRAWLVEVGVPLDLVYLCCALLGNQVASSPYTARFLLVETQQGHEPWDAWLHVAFVEQKQAAGAVLPDASRLLGVRIHQSFLDAVRQARERVIDEQLLDPSLDVLWWIRFADRGKPPLLSDASVGMAAGVAMAGRAREAGKVPAHWFFSGSVDDLRSDDGFTETAALAAKYMHLQSTGLVTQLIVPQPAIPALEHEMGSAHGIQGVRSVQHVLNLAADPSACSRLLLPFGRSTLRPVSPWTLRKLVEIATRAETQGDAACLVTGAPGTGKGDLLQALYQKLHDRWIVVRHHCDAQRRGRQTFIPFRDLLTQLRQRLTKEATTAEARMLDTLLHDLDASPPEMNRFRVRRSGIGRRLFEQVALTLGELSKKRPIALLLDDLHRAGESSLALFQHLAGSIHAHGRRLLLVGGMHREADQEYGGRKGLEEMGIPALDMEALPEAGKEALVREALARRGCMQPDPGLVRLLLQRAGANILHLQLLVNWLHGTGKLLTERGQWALVAVEDRDVPPLEEIIRWFVAGAGLGVEDTLQHAATIGREFSLDMLVQTTGRDPRDLEKLLERSELVQVMQTPDKSRPVYEFLHMSFAVWITDDLARLHPDYKSLLHRKVAEAYETELLETTGHTPPWHRQQPPVDRDVCHLLAFHWQEGNRPDLAVEHWMDLAVRDRQRGAYDTALRRRRNEVACRRNHIPSDPDSARESGLALVSALVDQAAIYRLRQRDGDLTRADEVLREARGVLQDVLGSSHPVVPERLARLGGAFGASWLLEAARAETEAGEVARLTSHLDQAQARLEAAMHWGERLRTLTAEQDHKLRRDAWRVLAKAGCHLMSLYMTRAMHYMKYEPGNEDARRAQEVRVMYLCTRLLALSRDPLFQGSAEAAELCVPVLRTQGNVFFWLEGNPRLAVQYYARARALLHKVQSPVRSAVGAPVGSMDEDIHNMLALVCLSRRNVPGAVDELAKFRKWADDVGARDHQATAAFTTALVEIVVATAPECWRQQWGVRGDLDVAARLLDTAIDSPVVSYPEFRLRALLLRRWIAARPDRDEDPTRWDQRLEQARRNVWRDVPADLKADPEAHLYCEVMLDVGWWVEQQVRGTPAPSLQAALKRYHALVAGDGGATEVIDLPDEMAARARARLSPGYFLDRVQAVAVKVEQLRRLHYPGDGKRRMLQCAAWVHDCLHEISDPQRERLAEDWGVTEDPLEHAVPFWLHGLLGYRLVEQELAERLDDEGEAFKHELRSAVRYHTWPCLAMTPSTQLFYVAGQLVKLETIERSLDEPEQQRAREIREELERLASSPVTLPQAVEEAARWSVERRRARGEPIHPRTLELLDHGCGQV